MSRRDARLRAAAVAITVLSAVLALISGVFGVLNRDAAAALGIAPVDAAYATSGLISAAVGLIIAWRHPAHLVAWTFIAIGLTGEMSGAFRNYGFYGTTTVPGSLPAAGILAWIASWGFVFPAAGYLLAPLVFPNGRLLGRRWWIVVSLIVVGLGLIGTAFALGRDDAQLVSPFGFVLSVQDVEGLVRAGGALLSIGVVGAGASLMLRFRRARGDERLQIKWVVYASCAAVVATLVAIFLLTQPEPVRSLFRPFSLSPTLIPIAAAIAILRYRLYDIDVLINRTLVYGAVSVVLAATYAGGVVVLQTVLRQVTGGSALSVALTTLVVVALFQPLRSRMQDLVDRRFYRARYDAARTIDAFSVRLRGDVDLDSVRRHLIGVVEDAIHPAHTSLWLRRTSR